MTDDEIRFLAKEVDRERIARAKATPPQEKLLAGEELFRMAERITLAGIRMQNPDLDEADALNVLLARLEDCKRQEMKFGAY